MLMLMQVKHLSSWSRKRRKELWSSYEWSRRRWFRRTL